MAIIASGWSRQVEVVGQSPALGLTGYVALITEANVPEEFWNIVKDGGGDLRICVNSDGSDELPIEVVICNTTSKILRVFLRFPNYSATLKSCWLFYGNSSATKNSVGSAFGQYAVWQDFYLVVHGITDLNDSTQNAWTPEETGTVLITTTLGMRCSASNYLQFPTIPNLGYTDVSVGAIVNTEWYDTGLLGGTPRGSTIFNTRGANSNVSPTLVVAKTGSDTLHTSFLGDTQGVAAGSQTNLETLEDVDTIVDGTVNRNSSGGKHDGVWTVVQDGTLVNNNNVSLGGYDLGSQAFNGEVTIGQHHTWDNDSTVNIKYLQVAKALLPDDYLLLKQQNYMNSDTFWSTGTPQDVAASGVVMDVNAIVTELFCQVESVQVTSLQVLTPETTHLLTETEQNTVGQFVSLASAESQMLLESVTLDISNSLALASVESELYINVAPVVAQQVISLSAASSELVLASEVQAVAQSINLDAALSQIHVATEQNTVGQFVSLSFVSSEATIFSPAVSSASQIPVESIDTQLRINTVPITLEAENSFTAIASYLDINTETGIPGYLSNVAINPTEVQLETESNTVGYQVAITSVASEAVLNSATLTIEQSISVTAVASESDIKTVPASLDTASALVTVTTESLVEAQVLEAGQEIQLFVVSSESLVESETLNLSGEFLLVAVAVESRLESETGIPGYQQDIDAVAVESPIQVETLTLDAAIDFNVVISESLIEASTSTVDTISDINPVVSEVLLQTETLNLGALITVNAVETESLLDVNIIEIIQQKLDTGDSMIQPITTLTRFVLAPKTRIYKLTMK